MTENIGNDKQRAVIRDCVIVVSGGMDSITLLYDMKDRIGLAVTFNYGSNHNAREIEYAKIHCSRLGIKHVVIELGFIHDFFHSSLLEGADAIPEGHYEDANMKSTVVPFRNGIMLSVAAGLAESYGFKHLLIANHSGDHAIYPDCRPDFIRYMSEATKSGTYPGIDIIAPYTDISKGEIAYRGLCLGIDYSETWSCYKGGDEPCGKCGTCVERAEAIEYAKKKMNNR